MRPTSAELIHKIAIALEETVLPALGHDKWAASTVRSAMTLLAHLEARVDQEIPFLLADNADAALVLGRIRSLVELNALPEEAPEEAKLTPSRDAAALDTLNHRYQALFERLLHDRHDRAEIVGELRAYFKRRLAREHDMVFPAFTGPPF